MLPGSWFYDARSRNIPIRLDSSKEKGALLVENAANIRYSVLNGESADVPEDIVADCSLCFPCNGYRCTPKEDIFSVDETVMQCSMQICVYRSAHVINNQVPRGRPPLFHKPYLYTCGGSKPTFRCMKDRRLTILCGEQWIKFVLCLG